MPITSLAAGSGIDGEQIVSQLMQIERQPITALQQKEAAVQVKLTSLGKISGALSSLQSAVDGLRTLSSFDPLSTTSSDTAALSIATSTGVTPGTHTVTVHRLAQAHRLASTAFTDTTSALGTGTLTIQVGSGDAKQIAIGDGNSNLAGIRDAINAASAGVVASIVNDGTGYRLSLAANDTGASKAIKVTVSGDGDGNDTDASGLSRFSFTTGAERMTTTLEALDSLIDVDGITGITRATNTVSDVISGITMTLKKADATKPITVGVTRDVSAVKAKVQLFVNSYNTAAKAIADATAYDAKTKASGPLIGDSAVGAALRAMQGTLGSPIEGLTGSFTTMGALGVTTNRDGTLGINDLKLTAAIDAHYSDIGALFASRGLASDSGVKVATMSAKTGAGNYVLNVSQAATQATYTGVALGTSPSVGTPLVITAGVNDQLEVKVGDTTRTLTLTAGSYTSGSALATELQNRIAANSELSPGGVAGATVTFSTDHFVLTSKEYGSESAAVVNGGSAAADLGFTGGTAAAGVDVAGSIDGSAGKGLGQRLTFEGTGPEAGLALDITGTTTGMRGTLSVSIGTAEKLWRRLSDITNATSGLMVERRKTYEKMVDTLQEQQEKISSRLGATETSLRRQYTSLGKLLTSLNSTSSFLTQQLANLAGTSDKK